MPLLKQKTFRPNFALCLKTRGEMQTDTVSGNFTFTVKTIFIESKEQETRVKTESEEVTECYVEKHQADVNADRSLKH